MSAAFFITVRSGLLTAWPSCPGAPGGPAGPCGPRGPGSPGLKGIPSGLMGAGGPGGPGGPSGPRSPFSPFCIVMTCETTTVNGYYDKRKRERQENKSDSVTHISVLRGSL